MSGMICFSDELFPRPHEDHHLPEDGGRLVHRRTAQLPNLQTQCAREVRLHAGTFCTTPVRPNNGGEAPEEADGGKRGKRWSGDVDDTEGGIDRSLLCCCCCYQGFSGDISMGRNENFFRNFNVTSERYLNCCSPIII